MRRHGVLAQELATWQSGKLLRQIASLVRIVSRSYLRVGM
jgi:hypothetical protein